MEDDYDLVELQKCLQDEGPFRERLKMGSACGKMGTEDDWIQKLIRDPASEGRRDYSPHEDDEAADGTFREETRRHPQQRAEGS